MVIGRRHRIGIDLSAERTQRHPLPQKLFTPKVPRLAPRNHMWTAEEDQILREFYRKGSQAVSAMLPGRTVGAIDNRRKGLRLSMTFRFAPEQDALIRDQYSASVRVEDIADHLGCKCGSLKQRIMFLGLNRDARKTCLAKRFGADVLSLSNDPTEIRRGMIDRERLEKERLKSENRQKVETALDVMVAGLLAGNDRTTEMRAAMIAGATLENVGSRVGITRERVRQIVHKIQPAPKPPREVICGRCQSKFECSGSGKRIYCDDCRMKNTEELTEKKREYQREYNQSRPKSGTRSYNMVWMRRKRLKETMLEMNRSELAKILKDVADIVASKSVDK